MIYKKHIHSPTLKQKKKKKKTLRIITSITTQHNYNVHQLDIKRAYLNKRIYIDIPEDYSKNKNCFFFWILNKSFYDSCQNGLSWNDKLNDTLLELKIQTFNK